MEKYRLLYCHRHPPQEDQIQLDRDLWCSCNCQHLTHGAFMHSSIQDAASAHELNRLDVLFGCFFLLHLLFLCHHKDKDALLPHFLTVAGNDTARFVPMNGHTLHTLECEQRYLSGGLLALYRGIGIYPHIDCANVLKLAGNVAIGRNIGCIR